ncbi:MAG: TonB-dependent receptor [Bacteroidota bacterium]|nr:TonB-dependent receptor [Bacteroidota bacterium]
MKLFRNTALILFLLIGQFGKAQQGGTQIRGSVYSSDNEPAMFSTIMLLDQDSVLIGGALTKEDGSFIIEKVAPGNYSIQVKNMGFHTYTSKKLSIASNENLSLDKITLIPSTTQLDEAVVTARKAMVEIRADKIVYNVASSPNASGNNGMELIGKAPGIIVDMDKNIILQGKSGVQIYINGRPTRLSGNDLTNFLESLRSENIESMEIITNPSSKYDAEGTAGVINIVLKKNTSLGFNGNATGSFSQGTFSRSSVGTSLNYSGEKINLFTSLSVSDNNWQTDFDETTYQSGFLLDKNSKSENNSKAINFSGGLDYTINPEQSVSIDGRVLVNKRDNVLRSTTGVFDTTDLVNGEILRAAALDKMPSENYILNANYRNAFSETSNLSADLSFGKYSSKKNTLQPNDYVNAVDGVILRTLNKEYDANTQIDLWSTKVDYEKKLKKITLSSGAKYSYITTGNQLAFYNVENGLPIFDNTRSNDFNYLEKVAAVYFILNVNPTDKLMINAGLRMENTSSLGLLESKIQTDNNRVSRNYLDFFPNLGISFDDKKNNALSISYGRRITRPNYQDLNPFESRSSELSAWKGNPFLKPNYIDNYQISYSFKRKLVISNTYSVTHDFFATIFEISQEKGNVLIPRNMQKSTNNGLSVSYPLRIIKWWDLSSFFNYNFETYKGDLNGTKIDLKASTYNLRLQNNLQLPKAVTMELTYYLNSPWIWRGSVNVEGFSGLSIGVKKEFLDKKLLVQLTGNDILNTSSDYHYKSNYGGMIVDGVISFDNRRAGISATYKFGNQKAKARKKSKSGIDDELKRISE